VLEPYVLEPKKTQAPRQDDARRSGYEQKNTCEKIHVSVDPCQPSTPRQRNAGALDRNITRTQKEGRSALVQRQSAQFPREENTSQPNGPDIVNLSDLRGCDYVQKDTVAKIQLPFGQAPPAPTGVRLVCSGSQRSANRRPDAHKNMGRRYSALPIKRPHTPPKQYCSYVRYTTPFAAICISANWLGSPANE
jgi:hypothetical protein